MLGPGPVLKLARPEIAVFQKSIYYSCERRPFQPAASAAPPMFWYGLKSTVEKQPAEPCGHAKSSPVAAWRPFEGKPGSFVNEVAPL